MLSLLNVQMVFVASKIDTLQVGIARINCSSIMLQVKMALQYMRRVIQKKAKFDITRLDCVQVCFQFYILAPMILVHPWSRTLFMQNCLLEQQLNISSLTNRLHPNLLLLLYLGMQKMTNLFILGTLMLSSRHMRYVTLFWSP